VFSATQASPISLTTSPLPLPLTLAGIAVRDNTNDTAKIRTLHSLFLTVHLTQSPASNTSGACTDIPTRCFQCHLDKSYFTDHKPITTLPLMLASNTVRDNTSDTAKIRTLHSLFLTVHLTQSPASNTSKPVQIFPHTVFSAMLYFQTSTPNQFPHSPDGHVGCLHVATVVISSAFC